MIAIEFKFPAGRYHAAAWGKHANDEDSIEWPPSPWRIVRALACVWKRALPDLPEETVKPIILKLASELPKFHLPRAAVGHTRHYMPIGELDKRVEKTKLYFDTFASMKRGAAVYAIWDGVELDANRTQALASILAAMPYLGRAESWTQARLADCPPPPNSMPLELTDAVLDRREWETTFVLASSGEPRFGDILAETRAILGGGRPIPESAKRTRYARKRNSLERGRGAGFAKSRRTPTRPTVVRLAMLGETHQPSVVDALRWGDAAHKAAVKIYKGKSATLLGRDGDTGAPISDPRHPHAFYLPADEDGDGKLDTLTVWARCGFSKEELDALFDMRTLYISRRETRVDLRYLNHGVACDFESVSPLFGRAKCWESATPYIPTRHLPKRGKYSAKNPRAGWEMLVRREIANREYGWNLKSADFGVAGGARMSPVVSDSGSGALAAEFFKHRANGKRAGAAMSARLAFSEEIRGPVVLGYACHFGMGLFAPSVP